MTNSFQLFSNGQMVTGIIFDLDGTLVDSKLDFMRIRRALGLKQDEPILEAIDRIEDESRRDEMHQILIECEMAGAKAATLMPGVVRCLEELGARQIRTAVFTRNARPVAEFTLKKLGLETEHLIAREDAPPKPDPAGLLEICSRWSCQPEEVLFVGDYLFDLEAGERAGVTTALYTPTPPDFKHDAKWVFEHFDELFNLCTTIFKSAQTVKAHSRYC